MFEAKAEAEAKALRPRPRPKFWPRGRFGLEALTYLFINWKKCTTKFGLKIWTVNKKSNRVCVLAVVGGAEFKSTAHGKKHESVISTAATMRVLNILRHWVSKHAQVCVACSRHDSTTDLKYVQLLQPVASLTALVYSHRLIGVLRMSFAARYHLPGTSAINRVLANSDFLTFYLEFLDRRLWFNL